MSLLEWADFADHVFTALAVVAGGFWVFFLRGHAPRLGLTHELAHFPVAPGRVLLTVAVRLENKGSVRISIANVVTRILQVLPLPLGRDECERIAKGTAPLASGAVAVEWPMLGESDHRPEWKSQVIEPGETDEVVFDFVIPETVESIRVYTYVANVKQWRKGLAWAKTTVLTLGNTQQGERK